MPKVVIKENEPFNVALRKFKRLLEKSGLLKDLRAREFHEKRSQERKRKKIAARKRLLKKLTRERQMLENAARDRRRR